MSLAVSDAVVILVKSRLYSILVDEGLDVLDVELLGLLVGLDVELFGLLVGLDVELFGLLVGLDVLVVVFVEVLEGFKVAEDEVELDEESDVVLVGLDVELFEFVVLAELAGMFGLVVILLVVELVTLLLEFDAFLILQEARQIKLVPKIINEGIIFFIFWLLYLQIYMYHTTIWIYSKDKIYSSKYYTIFDFVIIENYFKYAKIYTLRMWFICLQS